MTRGRVAWLVVLTWALVLGWNARREFFRPEAERIALGAALLPPGAAYYALDVDGRRAGMVSVEIDTLPARAGFRITEQFTVRLPGMGRAGETEIRTDTWLGPGVTLDSLRRVTVHGGDTLRTAAFVAGDSLRWEGRADTLVRSVSEASSVQTAASWPLRYVAAGGADTDEVRRFTLLNPVGGDLREVDLRTVEIDTRVFADSADTDTRTGEWIVAGRDTVTAWRVERVDAPSEGSGPGAGPVDGRPAGDPVGGPARLEAWVDEDGRFVEAELDGGLRIRRTAFELAFFPGSFEAAVEEP